jgi:hypothetical protein
VDDDCPLGEICEDGACAEGCRPGADRCPRGTECVDGKCRPRPGTGSGDGGGDDGGTDSGTSATTDTAYTGEPVVCPDDMASAGGRFCIDIYEASRPDATEDSVGTDTSRAVSQVGVMPWNPVTLDEARAACAAAGKYLCTGDEFYKACIGPDGTAYAYGDAYDPVICNSIDTYCACDSTACEGIDECPYPHCYNQPPENETEPEEGCGAGFHLMPTGSFSDCTNEYGVLDINGNVWELVDDGSGEAVWRGGAYNCIDSEKLHRCDFLGGNILARGFRCCSAGIR